MTDLFNIQDFQKGANLRTPQQTQSKAPIFNATDNKIQELANTQTAPTPTIRTKQKMFEDMAKVQKNEWVTDVEALALVKNYYTEKWYTVEWMDLEQPTPENEVSWAFEDNKTFLSRIEEKARQNVEIEWEIDTSNRNVFRKFFDRTANDARAFSWLVEALIWEWFETTWQLASFLSPDVVEKPFKDEVKRQFDMVIGSDVAQTIWTTAKWIWYTAKEVFEMLPEEVQQDVENLGVIWIWVLDLIGTWYLWKEWVKLWAKWWVALWEKTIKTKNYLFPQESLNDLIAKASQAKTAPDLKAFKDSISLIDTAKMNTYNDLWKSFSKKIWAMSTKVDDMLSTKPVYNIEDLTTTVWKRQTNYVNSAIDDLKKVWAKENDLEFLAKVDDLEDIVKWSEKDINDLARFYGTKFKNKSFSKTTWEPLSSVSASRFENNRAWLKNLVRDKNGNSALKEMDLQISELYTAKWLVDDMGKKVQNLFNKTITRWPLAWLWAWTVRLANTLSWGSIWWALSALWVQSNIWKKTLDVLSIQKNLNKTLQQIDRMESMLDWGKLSNANKAYIERFFSEFNAKAMSILPKETPKVVPKTKAKLSPAEQAFKDEVGFKKADVSPSKTQINTKWFINPQAIVDDIAKIWKKATPTQINNLAKKITVGLNLATEEIKAVYKIVREWLEKQWTKAKPKMAELMDELADKVPWTKSKFLDDTKIIKTPTSLLENKFWLKCSWKLCWKNALEQYVKNGNKWTIEWWMFVPKNTAKTQAEALEYVKNSTVYKNAQNKWDVIHIWYKNDKGKIIWDEAFTKWQEWFYVTKDELLKVDANNLVVLHNLSADKLKSIQELWGMPWPSLAVTKKTIPFEDFGDITLVWNKALIQSLKAKTYSADIYSPRVPQPSLVLKKWKEINQRVTQMTQDLSEYKVSWYEIINWLEEWLWTRNYWLKALYAKEKWLNIDIATKMPSSWTFTWYNQIARIKPETLKKYFPENFVKNQDNELFIGQMQKIMDKAFTRVEAPKLSYFDAEAMHSYLTNLRAKKIFDKFWTSNNIDDAITKAWLTDDFERFTEKISNELMDKKLYKWRTNLWRPSYWEYTLDTVLKNMFKWWTQWTESGWLFTQWLSGQLWKNAKSLSIWGIKKTKFWSSKQLDIKYQALKDEWIRTTSWDINDFLADSFSLTRPSTNIVDEINRFSASKISIAEVDRLKWIMKEAMDLPKSYIETKIKRAVQLDEFTYALVPKAQMWEVKTILKWTWLEDRIVWYTPKPWARTELIQKISKYWNVFFWLWWALFTTEYLSEIL